LPEIHPTAVIDKRAELADDVTVGPNTVIQGDVVIGKGTKIHSNALIADGARIGENCEIHHGAVLSTWPQYLGFGGEKTTLEIGDRTVIREYCDLNKGTTHNHKTVVGSDCFIMAYTHVAHDCVLGDHVICANSVQMAGHVIIEDWAFLSGLIPVHQFVRIGQHSFIGGGYRVPKDVPPYIMAGGEPLSYKGLNIVGLGRRGFSKETIRSLRKVYRTIYRSKLNTKQALERIRSDMEVTPEVQSVIDFIENSERGIIR